MPSRLTSRPALTVGMLALLALLAWLPVLWIGPTADESGYLMIARQWSHGSSLYGDYWVDRPPLLLILFSLAAAGGGTTALRLLGMTAVVVSVLLAARIGRLAAPADRTAPVVGAATATVFLADPLFGRGAVNGELLALPLVLSGLTALLEARARPGRRGATAWWAAAGAAAAGAALVKQNFVDVFLVAAVLLLVPVAGVRRLRAAAALVAGAAGVVTGVLAYAASRGTDPAGLWEAVVVFRVDAGRVIDAAASGATPLRAARLGLVLAVSGGLALLVLGARRLLRAPTPDGLDLRLAAVVLVTWEVVAMAAGGSYWLHYLTGIVPGLVVLTTVAADGPAAAQASWRRWRTRLLGWATAVTAVALVVVALFPVPTKERVAAYLDDHAHRGDTAVVAFGKPDILYGAGLDSPYPLLWSLPVRVLDPHLLRLGRVLASPDRPTWVVAGRAGLSGWGLTPARRVLDTFERHYRAVAEVDDMVIYLVRARGAAS
ncbi:hypothetical protein [Nocardioides currus]|uniref:Glycosyltransferase RgtA/B/C/D-like domain-containing protein n=1 Tax=Nocardioides currus TaxID=2133958 RepID=A0A2R7YX57_9ACTN|nr:hypothetical protein [Nocardioides currus]PUA80459.1 hypothetical protein C7S10_15195 [Nocardioides currus]